MAKRIEKETEWSICKVCRKRLVWSGRLEMWVHEGFVFPPHIAVPEDNTPLPERKKK